MEGNKMDYTLHEISEKMGVPEFPEREEMLYYYNDTENANLGGHGEIRLEDRDRLLTASLYHKRENYEDDNGIVHKTYEETVQINACRLGSSDTFRIVHMEIDGKPQSPTDPAMVELGLAIFHSRMVDINIGMVEQTFGILDDNRQNKGKSFEAEKHVNNNTVIPFPSRTKSLTI